MFKEGGRVASVKPIKPSDNRGAGSSMGHQLRQYPNGTKIRIKPEFRKPIRTAHEVKSAGLETVNKWKGNQHKSRKVSHMCISSPSPVKGPDALPCKIRGGSLQPRHSGFDYFPGVASCKVFHQLEYDCTAM
jgi:hypothetical protein